MTLAARGGGGASRDTGCALLHYEQWDWRPPIELFYRSYQRWGRCDFSKGNRGRVLPPEPEPEGKVRITIRLDQDIVDRFFQMADASGGATGYQALINAALREYLDGKAPRFEDRETHRFAVRAPEPRSSRSGGFGWRRDSKGRRWPSRSDELRRAALAGVSVRLLVGLNTITSPQALAALRVTPNCAVRYFTRRFHAKIYISDTAALLGSSNLTQDGMKRNREATMHLAEPADHALIEELRTLFNELWSSASVLTAAKLEAFAAERKKFNAPQEQLDGLIEAVVGRSEPININVGSAEQNAERIFLETLRRQVEEQYIPAFKEVSNVSNLLRDKGFRRAELSTIGTANETNRFLNWLRLTHAPGDETWAATPLRSSQEREAELVRFGSEWTATDDPEITPDYLARLGRVRDIFRSGADITEASQERLTEGLMSVHAFTEQLRFVKGGEAALAPTFWEANGQDVGKVRRTLSYWLFGPDDFACRLHDLLYDPAFKLAYFGKFCALELLGTVRPDQCPPLNGRMAKALRFIGFNVAGH